MFIQLQLPINVVFRMIYPEHFKQENLYFHSNVGIVIKPNENITSTYCISLVDCHGFDAPLKQEEETQNIDF